ncbi:MAG: baseplate assembly protein [Caulobacteraceae bacterium]|nr:MAG: baseplate assembly protein [Caulobacteraceae bacterium]
MPYPKSPPPDFLGAGWAFPIDAVGGKVAMKSDAALISQSIGLILSTSRGERVMEPTFGCDLKQMVFEANNAQSIHLADHAVRSALQQWEPRIKVSNVAASVDPDNRDVLLISIDYVIRAFNSRHNLVYPFYLGGSR